MKSAVIALSCLCGAAVAAAQTDLPQPLKPGNGVSAPVLLSEVKPSYPPGAVAAGLSGAIMLEAVVETDGTVGDVRVLKPLEPSLDGAAVAAMKRWRFKPGTKEGKPVRVAVEVEMTFTLRSDGPALDSSEVFKPGPGIKMPAAIKEVKPSYTDAARAAGVQGAVTVECVVLPDGRVGDTRVTRKLDPELDLQAIRAMRQWRFKPGERNGQPVPVQVFVEMTFSLK